MSEDRKRWPVLTLGGVLLPAICVCAALVPDDSTHYSSGGWGLGEIFIFFALIFAGLALGALSSLLALLRREAWRPLQAILLLANVAATLYLARPFVRSAWSTPPMPV